MLLVVCEQRIKTFLALYVKGWTGWISGWVRYRTSCRSSGESSRKDLFKARGHHSGIVRRAASDKVRRGASDKEFDDDFDEKNTISDGCGTVVL